MKNQFIKYYYQGLSDNKISKFLNVSRKEIGQLRKSLNLPRTSRLAAYKEQIIKFVDLGYSDQDISKQLSLPSSTIQDYRKKLKLKTNFVKRKYANRTDRRKGYILRNIKFSAKKRNLDFNLKYSDFELPIFCPILGVKLEYGKNTNSPFNASIDRIDNTKGYIRGNIIVISRKANLMKNDASLEDLQIYCTNMEKLINYYKTRGALGSVIDVFPDTVMYEEKFIATSSR